jgi:hypothetical protein
MQVTFIPWIQPIVHMNENKSIIVDVYRQRERQRERQRQTIVQRQKNIHNTTKNKERQNTNTYSKIYKDLLQIIIYMVNNNTSMVLQNDLNSVLSDFPLIKLSYETTVHKKVYDAHVVFAIPDGCKHYAWFTTHNNQNVCWLLELTPSNTICKVTPCLTSFSDTLSYGTIVYGTVFTNSTHTYFSIEDIFYYKSTNLQEQSYLKRLEIIENMLTNELSMNKITNNYVTFGVPSMDTQFYKLLTNIQTLPYKCSTIQFRYLEGPKKNKIHNMKYIKPRNQNMEKNTVQLQTKPLFKTVFKVMADIQNDIYKLYTLENGNYVYYDTAHIPSYTTSVMMNRLFRYIKENNNLDALEESDDEDDFENNNLDKHVFLDRDFLMNCEWNNKFKKWTPVNLASDGATPVSSKQLRK